jgi:ankyrin repeat protein
MAAEWQNFDDLLRAFEAGNVHAIEAFRGNLNGVDVRGYGIVWHAMGRQVRRQLDVLNALLARGVRFNVRISPLGTTPLVWAAFQHTVSVDVLRWLIDVARVDVNQPDVSGQLPLHAAVTSGSVAKVEVLLKVPTLQRDKRSSANETARDLAVAMGRADVLERFDLAPQLWPVILPEEDLTPLHAAIRRGDVGFIARYGGDVNKPNPTGFTPLRTALLGYSDVDVQLRVLDALVAKHADVNRSWGLGTPLLWAAYSPKVPTAVLRALQILDWPSPSLLDMFEVSVVVAQELRDEDPDPHSWSACRSETWTGACPPTNH